MVIESILQSALKYGASDIHLSIDSIPSLRVNGKIMKMGTNQITKESMDKIIKYIIPQSLQQNYQDELDLDFAISKLNNRFRVNAFNTIKGNALSIRVIDNDIKSMSDLNLPQSIQNLANLKHGLVLVTGPTGSGKSTTLAALVDHLNTNFSHHIITIEDPIEYVHTPKKSIISHREVGPHTKSFAKALKSALREDPDVILVGELRDIETIKSAMTAAETGHLVLGTLHTNTAPSAITRIIDAFPANDKAMATSMLSNSIQAVVCQTLLETVDKKRVAAQEILIANTAIRNLIKEHKIPQIYSMMQVNKNSGNKLMADSIQELLKQGKISEATAAEYLPKDKE